MPNETERRTPPAANERQVAGKHYLNRPIQPWDYITANDMRFLEGEVVKLVTRHREKGGRSDLEKAIHYLQKAREVYYPDVADAVAAASTNKDSAERLATAIAAGAEIVQAQVLPTSEVTAKLNDLVDKGVLPGTPPPPSVLP